MFWWGSNEHSMKFGTYLPARSNEFLRVIIIIVIIIIILDILIL